MNWETLLSSTVIAGLVAALISLRTNERKIHIENITQERAKWRASMRELADGIIKAATTHDSQIVTLQCSQLSLNLNPFDAEDKALILVAQQLANPVGLDSRVQEFTDRMALLLKHDWDRAKREAHPTFYHGGEPRRVPYCEFKCDVISQPRYVGNGKLVPAIYFGTLMLSAGIMFFLAVGLTEPFKMLVLYMNDQTVTKPATEWATFTFLSVLCGSFWVAAYLWFKGSEKRFLEIWFGK